MVSRSIRSIALDAAILFSWLICVGLVALHERGGWWKGRGHPLTSLGATLDAKEQWFGIYYHGQRIGFSEMTMTPDERNGIPGVSVTDRGRLVFNLLGAPQQLEVFARAFIDADWRLQTFTAEIRAAAYRLKWVGERHGDVLRLVVSTPGNTVTKWVRDPTGGAFVNGLSSWAAFHRLRVGQSGKAWVLNPLALSPEAVYFVVRRTDMIDGQEALVVETDVSGMTSTSWVTREGDVLKELSPLGWELRHETREYALAHTASTTPTLDLLSTAAVPLDQPLDDVAALTELTLLVEGVGAERLTVQRPWQQVLPAERLQQYRRAAPEGPWCLLQMTRPVRPDTPASVPERVAAYQHASLFVQSDDPRIRAKAAKIIGSRTDPWDRVQALHRWVFSTMTKRLTVGLPSAVDVLQTPIGDCHEHTVLFTALARSVGLPTRMIAGLVYMQGQFYYHAWPEVWIGQWIPTDPTLGQLVADLTHIALVEAENEQLISLGQFVGKMRLHVLDTHAAAPPASRSAAGDAVP
ncbi:MAG: transglutaminase domain-containing protein [Candidatus Omnitrophica bacterium]|nr:transglutaminase domain-containing protein [Candidatus Omnitrophota bacterium]